VSNQSRTLDATFANTNDEPGGNSGKVAAFKWALLFGKLRASVSGATGVSPVRQSGGRAGTPAAPLAFVLDGYFAGRLTECSQYRFDAWRVFA
jgi:hypothetical protein